MKLHNILNILFAADDTVLGASPDPPADPPVADPPAEPAAPPSWTEQLPKDMRGNEAWQGFEKGVPDLAQAYLDATEKLKVPGEDASDEEKAAYIERLGWGEQELADPEGIQEGLKLSAEDRGAFAKAAKDLGLTPAQAEGMLGLYYTSQSQGPTDAEREASFDAAFQKLTEVHGDAAAAQAQLTRQVATHFLGEEVMQALQDAGLDNHSGLVMGLNKIAQEFKEDSFVDGDPARKVEEPKDPWERMYGDEMPGPPPPGVTPTEEEKTAQEKFDSIYK